MENALWYVAGFVTPFATVPLLVAWTWLTDKNLERNCWICGRQFGEIGKEYVRLTNLRFRWHRRNGECKRNAK